MLLVDAHCDTLLAAAETGQTLRDNLLQVDLAAVHAMEGRYLQFFAVFLHPSWDRETARRKESTMLTLFREEAGRSGSALILGKEDLSFHSIGLLLSYEGLGHSWENSGSLEGLYGKGVRCASLTWNQDNQLAGGIFGSSRKGLTAEGWKAVRTMESLGILLDVSHLSQEGFRDVSCGASKPFVATHSNVRALCHHRRNLEDWQIRELASAGGVMGINAFSDFLRDDGMAGTEDLVRHIEYVCGLVGEDHVGFGSDFDGMVREKSALTRPEGWMNVLSALRNRGFSRESVEKIAGLNFLRVLASLRSP